MQNAPVHSAILLTCIKRYLVLKPNFQLFWEWPFNTGFTAFLFSEAADSENMPQWEKDLQKELQDYEMVNDNNELDDLDIENEILQQIENETDNPWFKHICYYSDTINLVILKTRGDPVHTAGLQITSYNGMNSWFSLMQDIEFRTSKALSGNPCRKICVSFGLQNTGN